MLISTMGPSFGEVESSKAKIPSCALKRLSFRRSVDPFFGAIVMPPLPAFYHCPQTIRDLIDHSVNRVLDLLEIELENDLFARWEGPSNLDG